MSFTRHHVTAVDEEIRILRVNESAHHASRVIVVLNTLSAVQITHLVLRPCANLRT